MYRYFMTLERFFESTWQQHDHVKFAGFTSWTTNYISILIAAVQLKRTNPDVFIVAGGPQVTESKKSAALGIEGRIFDSVVMGEGEQPLLDLYTEFTENGFKGGSKLIPGVLKHSSLKLEEAGE